MSTTIQFQHTVDIDDDDMAGLIEMAGYGINYWATWAKHDAEARTYEVRYEDLDDPDKEARTVLSYEALGKVLVEVATGQHDVVNIYAQRYLASVMAGDSDAGDIDSELADIVVQLAIFGELVYG